MPPYFYHGKNPEARRRVLPGYPKDFVFKDYDEYKQYFVGDRIIFSYLSYRVWMVTAFLGHTSTAATPFG